MDFQSVQVAFFREHPYHPPNTVTFYVHAVSYTSDNDGSHCWLSALAEHNNYFYGYRFFPKGTGKREHMKSVQLWVPDGNEELPPISTPKKGRKR